MIGGGLLGRTEGFLDGCDKLAIAGTIIRSYHVHNNLDLLQ